MATIFIQKDEVYRTRIEDITDPQQFFYPVYEQARDSLLELTAYTKKYWDEHTPPATNGEDLQELWERKTKKTDLALPVINPMRLRGYPNNIIAFCADRGHGKTSAMLSFAKALKDSEKTEDKEKEFWQNKLQDYRFFALDPIDPTVLENTDHIIPTIISRMFAKFTKKAEKLHNSSRNSYGGYRGQDTRRDLRDQQQKLLKLFQNCYRLADEQKDSNKRSDNYDDLQLLADRGDSSNFKVRFWELVWNYLLFMNLNEAGYPSADLQKTFLVIQIDDADMNPKHAYDVVEDLRKYCVLPNVVILFATNLEQLEMCVEQHFVNSFEPMIKLTVSNDADSLKSAADSRRHCHYTTASYLDKLIPSLHRINLPDVNHTLQNFGTPIYLWHEAFHKEEDKKNPVEYQKALVDILKERCLLPLQSEADRLHPFLPRKMRELTHFLNRMSTLKEVGTRRELLQWAAGAAPKEYDDKRPYEMKRNLEFLMDYLVYDWCDLVLEPHHRRVIREIHRATTVRKIDVALEQLSKLEESKSPADPACTDSKWSLLEKSIDNLHLKEKDLLVCALELYFTIYKELLLVGTCITQRSGTTAKVAGMSTLGDCDTIWYAGSVANPRSTMGGFSFRLNQMASVLSTAADNTTKFVLNTWLHVKNETDNPDNKSIWELLAAGSNVEVVFDPLRSSLLDWETLNKFSEDPEKSNYLDQVEIRLALFANRPLQNKLAEALRKEQKAGQGTWTHFHQRMQKFWEIACEICLDHKYVSDSSMDSVLDCIFFNNEDNKAGHKKSAIEIIDPQATLSLVLKDISNLLDKLSVALPLVRSKEEFLHNLDLIDATTQVYKMWDESLGSAESLLDVLATPITNDLFVRMKNAHADVTSCEYNLLNISEGNVAMVKARIHLDKLNSEIKEIKALWEKQMGKNAVSKEENYPKETKGAVEMLAEKLDKWIENAKSAENAVPASET